MWEIVDDPILNTAFMSEAEYLQSEDDKLRDMDAKLWVWQIRLLDCLANYLEAFGSKEPVKGSFSQRHGLSPFEERKTAAHWKRKAAENLEDIRNFTLPTRKK